MSDGITARKGGAEKRNAKWQTYNRRKTLKAFKAKN